MHKLHIVGGAMRGTVARCGCGHWEAFIPTMHIYEAYDRHVKRSNRIRLLKLKLAAAERR